jgi:hypothetical protein
LVTCILPYQKATFSIIFLFPLQVLCNYRVYWAYYLSPTRSGTHSLEIFLKGNSNSGSGSKISADFPSGSFYSVMPGLYVNDNTADKDGISAIALPAGTFTELRVHSYFGDNDPSYSYTFNAGSVTITESKTSSTAAEERISFRPSSALPDGSVLTISDTANTSSASFTKSIAIAPPIAPIISSVVGGIGQAVVSWDAVPGAESYNVYYLQGDSVSLSTGTKLAGVTSPRTVTGLTNGAKYAFVVTAVNAVGESAASPVATTTAELSSPAISSVFGANGQVMVFWDSVPGATSYNLYFLAGTSVTTETGTKVTGAASPYTVTGLADNTNYAFIVTAVNESGESAASTVRTAWTSTPVPSISSVIGGDRQATVSWNAVAGATSYTIYYRSGTSVTTGNGTRVSGATSPCTITGLAVGSQYSFIVTATNSGNTESPASAIMTTRTLPVAPAIQSIAGGSRQATISWGSVGGATSYNLYYLAGTSVTTETGTKVTGAASPYTVTGLADNTNYAFIVTAVNESGESAASTVRTAWTSTPVPSISSVIGGDRQATVSWNAVAGATSYTIYYRSGTSVTTGNGTRVSGATSPCTITGLAVGSQYSFIVTATNSGNTESPASAIMTTRTLPVAPAIQSIAGGSRQATISWGSVGGATSYNLYYLAGTSVTTETGTKVTGAASPYTVTGLADNTNYAFIVTAVNESGESAASTVRTAWTSTPVPSISSVIGGDRQATVSWNAVAGATSYTIYYRSGTSVTTGNGTRVSGATSPCTITGLAVGSQYSFIVTATNSGNTESPASAIASTWTLPPSPSISSVIWSGDQATVSWDSVAGADTYNIYYREGTTVTTATGTKVGAVTSPHTITGLVAGNQYVFIVTAENGSGEGIPSQIFFSSSSAGTSWTSRNLPSAYNWAASAFGNNTFVAVTIGSGHAAYSVDGISWSNSNFPSEQEGRSIAYGNGTFVVVGSGNTAATSPDGISWTSRNMPSNREWRSITFGNGLFVAIPYHSSVVATSTDGVTWVERPLPLSQYWSSIAYGNGVFVAVALGNSSGDDTNTAAISSDGINWTTCSLPSAQNWYSVAFGNGRFVAINGDVYGRSFASSTDGISWTASASVSSSAMTRVSYGNGVFLVLFNLARDIVLISTDGINWTSRTLPSSQSWRFACFGNGVFIAIATGSHLAASSP